MGRRIECTAPGFSGYVILPDPFMASDYKRWLKVSREVRELEDEVDTLPIFVEWVAALSLVESWHIDGLVSENLRDEAPVAIQTWLRYAASNYLDEHLDPKNWQEPSETT